MITDVELASIIWINKGLQYQINSALRGRSWTVGQKDVDIKSCGVCTISSRAESLLQVMPSLHSCKLLDQNRVLDAS
ncbi:hypothetical protein AVEN_88484-1 [Araneus ventricosus]|uniref:Uncharacterized protein n=1 Tax=Araneus ventricosus TaxID=182803 RepID=A0A4Y2TWH7_ARAVE|nr:hypothetical protein AVEN_88484-1 [Araneus ventricosus]